MTEKNKPIDTQVPEVEIAKETSLFPIGLLAGQVLGEFKPCVVYIERMKVTHILLEDVPTVWCPWRGTAGMGHAVDLGYHAETGNLVGIKIWDDVRKRPT